MTALQIYYDNTAEEAVANVDEEVTWNTFNLTNGGVAMNFGTVAQDYFGQTGDMIDCLSYCPPEITAKVRRAVNVNRLRVIEKLF